MKRSACFFLLLALVLSVPALALTEEEMDAALLARGQEAIAECVAEDMTDVEKLTALHDWLAIHCDYGMTLRSDTAYGAIVEGSGVCRGYAEAMGYLAALAGLDGTFTYSPEMDHAWALATLEGDRYFCDCTWDDGKYQKLGLIRHRYFLFDEENAWETAGYYGWDSDETVPGGPMEAVPWRAAVTRVIFYGDWAYYIDRDFNLIRCDRDTWETEVLTSVEERWPDIDPEDKKLPEIFSGLVLARGQLYFCTPTRVCACALEDGEVRTLLTPDTSERLIYGLAVRNGVLCYSLAEDEEAMLYDIVDTDIEVPDAWGY